MADERELREGSQTIRVYGLDAKESSLSTAALELDLLLDDGRRIGDDAVLEWRGPHAQTFVEDGNRLLQKLALLVVRVRHARRIAAMWPDTPYADPTEERAAGMAHLGVPDDPGRSSAEPDKLDAFMAWCQSMCEQVPLFTSDVNLEGVTAEVTGPVSVGAPTYPELPPYDLPPDPPDEPLGHTTLETVPSLPGHWVDMPDLSDRSSEVVGLAGELGPWTGGIATAFRLGDDKLLDLIEDYPDLADELLYGFQDGVVSGESALVIMLAYFDEFDSAVTGDTDGEISLDDIFQMSCNREVPPYVEGAAQLLLDNPQLFGLIETMNDGMDHSDDVQGTHGDNKISRDDIETFIEFNDRLAVLEQNFDAFDAAASDITDGEVSWGDLERLAGGEGEIAAAAAWFLDHGNAWKRLAWYQTTKDGHFGKLTGSRNVTAGSLTLLAVDQLTYAEQPADAAGFVERRMQTLMSHDFSQLVDHNGMRQVFTSALTPSEQSGPLLDRIMAEVADDGVIHHPVLPQVFAEATANHMDFVDQRINKPSEHLAGEVPDDVRQDYLDTHDFLREIFRDPDAAERLHQAVFDFGMSETTSAHDAGQGRDLRLQQLGRTQAFVDMAHENALTGEAVDELREAAEQGSGLGPTPGSATDYVISHIPYAQTVNDIADGMGISTGDGVDWLLNQLGDFGTASEFDRLTWTEQIEAIRTAQHNVDRAVWVAVDLYHAEDPQVLASAQGQPFVDANGQFKTDMTQEEAQAFREWATSLRGTDNDPGPIRADENQIDTGSDEVAYPDHGIQVRDRR